MQQQKIDYDQDHSSERHLYNYSVPGAAAVQCVYGNGEKNERKTIFHAFFLFPIFHNSRGLISLLLLFLLIFE